MKFTVVLLFLSIAELSASVYSQSTSLTLNLKNTSVEKVLKQIESQSKYKFLYNHYLVDVNKKVDVHCNQCSMESILNHLFKNTNITYCIVDHQVVLVKNESSQHSSLEVLPPLRENLLAYNSVASIGFTGIFQQNKINGTVTDKSTGEVLPGVSIVIRGTTKGTITDVNGHFSIDVPAGEVRLVFSYMGYETQEVNAKGRTELDIELVSSVSKLDEVVVVGYGTAKKSDITGSLTSVSEKTLKERPVQNAIQALQGKAAGVDIVSNIRPGEIAKVTIRGTRSINGSNDPLYVVDGIIFMGSINDLNTNDISNIEILKDASATAIYGSRGANGVILITTKNGSKGQLTINYDASLTFDQIHSVTKWASAGEALDRMRLANINGGTYSGTLNYPDPTADINKFGNGDYYTVNAIRQGYEWNDPGIYSSVKMRASTADEIAKGWPAQVPIYNSGNIPGTDWIGLLTKTGITQNHQLSLSSGNENSKIYLSFGYFNNDGTQKNQNFRRYTAKINGDIAPLKWITVGTSINASMTKQQYGRINRSGSATGANDAYGIALGQYRMAKPYDSLGVMINYPGGNTTAPVWNPLIDINNTDDENKVISVQSNFYGELKFTPWLKYRMNFGSGFRYNRVGSWQGSLSTLRRTASPQTAAANYSTNDNFQYMLENLLYFDKKFGPHTIGATLMQSVQSNRTENSFINASKILYNTTEWYNQSANLNGNPDSYGTGYTKNQLMSYMGRLNYSLLNRYLFTASGRFDGASVLAEGHKWEFFPSFAVAWKMQEERFLKEIKWLSELKLRFGYGVTGNSAVGAYTTSGPLTQYNYVYENTPAIGYVPFTMPNPNLKWEQTDQTDIGLDFGFLANDITGTIDVYQSNTSKNLMERAIPAIIGFPSITDNIGKVRNRGIEISLSTVNIKTSNFRWTTDLNWSKNKEEIVELVNGKQDMTGNGWYIGQPIQDMRTFRAYEVAGLWQNTTEDLAEIAKWKANGYNFAPGQYKPVEQGTPNYKLEDNDKVIKGNPRPKWIGGMTNTFSYMNFELSGFMYARIGQSYFSSLQPGGSTSVTFNAAGYVRHMNPDNFWSPEHPNAEWPQPTTSSNTSNADVNRSTFINDGSFVIVRNIALSYTVPLKYIKKFSIKNCQVYGQVLNPFIWGGKVVKAGINPDDTNGWTNVNSIGDPTGGTNNNTVIIRSWVLGLRVGF
ncbi:MAG: TonB-dependent receptor [Bacteroidota bacterium]|nr:TonB-dependent receptor [Bacteroidota bacterium]